jgi:benzil reductase ((S)-benzoin forming)
MKHIIITGHSKGLGAGITGHLLNKNHHIHGISRTDNAELNQKASATGCAYNFYACDLSQNEGISPVMEQVFDVIRQAQKTEGIYLINNAGVAGPIGPLEKLDPQAIQGHLRINLIAPLLLVQEFLKHTLSIFTEKRIINISSGAANYPYEGMSVYCTGKAALDMITRAVGAEQSHHPYPAEIMSIAPGVIDTDMQTYMRAIPDNDFAHKKKFVDLKKNNQLIKPEHAGKEIARFLFSKDFKNGDVTDIRNRY